MKKNVVFCWLITIMFSTTLSLANIPHMINYQAILLDSDGRPIRNQEVTLKFKIYDNSLNGDEFWEESQTDTTEGNGAVSLILGRGTAIPDSVFRESDRWLGVTINLDPEISPRTRLVSVPYAYRAIQADSTQYALSIADESVNSARILDGSIQLIDIGQNGAEQHQIIMWNGSSWTVQYIDHLVITDNSISQIKLKTSSGEVSSGLYSPPVQLYTLPGGQYGFYPQVRAASAVWGRHMVSLMGTAGMDYFTPPTSYATNVSIRAEGTTVYARQRYITSSGRDHWIFLLQDKMTRRIVAGYQAPDHPCYGSSGDELSIPHPFSRYDSTNQQIVLIDNAVLPELKAKVNSKQSLLTVINEEYMVDDGSQPQYTPREIIEIDEYGDKPGTILQKIKTPEWAKFLIEKDEIYLKRRIVKILPKYIAYKRLMHKEYDSFQIVEK